MRLLPPAALTLGLVACEPVEEEPALYEGAATDDNDGDGISNQDEVDQGTDPASADTDGDGYDDPTELAAGSDPADADDRVYQGGWPWNPDKDSIDDPGFAAPPEVGMTMPRFTALDQFGDTVDL